MTMQGARLEDVVRELLRSVVRDEIRAAIAEAAAEKPNAFRNGASDGYLSVAKAARHADVAPGTIRAWIRKGRLQSRRAGRVLRVSRSELEAFLATGIGTTASKKIAKRARQLLAA
jgi:excisionase family DNA binding protein